MTDRDERKIALGDRSVRRLIALYNQAEGAAAAAQAAIGVANQTAGAFRAAAAALFEANNLVLRDSDQLQLDLDANHLIAREPPLAGRVPEQPGAPGPDGRAALPAGAR